MHYFIIKRNSETFSINNPSCILATLSKNHSFKEKTCMLDPNKFATISLHMLQ